MGPSWLRDADPHKLALLICRMKPRNEELKNRVSRTEGCLDAICHTTLGCVMGSFLGGDRGGSLG